jgi:hypothetical protein
VVRKRESTADRTSHGPIEISDTSARKFLGFLQSIGAALFPMRVVVFVAFFAWYLYAVVDMRLVFQARDKLFLLNIDYFTDFIGKPGLLMEWTDNLLVQLCYLGWPGAIAVAATAWLLLVSTIGFMRALGRTNIGGTWVIPGILLVVLYSHYLFQTSMIVGLAMAMTAANGWCRTPVRQPWFRLALFVTISAALYYVTGASYYCFAACCVIHEELAEKRRLSGLFFLLAAIGVKFGLDAVLAHLYIASPRYHVPSDAYKMAHLNWCVILLYSYFPACAMFVVFRQTAYASINTLFQRLRKLIGKKDTVAHGKGKKHEKVVRPERTIASTGILRRIRWLGATVVMLSLAATAGFYFLNRDLKAFLEIDYCAEHRLWNDILVKAGNLPSRVYSQYVNHDVNLALYHIGRLPYQMFSYPQSYWPLFSMNDVYSDPFIQKTNEGMRKPCELLLELGRINEAEHVALEMLEMWPSGGTLKRLALMKMIKGQPAVARVFLNVLRDDLIWGRWAEGYLHRLETDPDLAGDEEIQRTRRLMISEDDLHLTDRFHFGGGTSTIPSITSVMLLKLLEQNNQNRMAFEYLMEIYLLSGDVQAAAKSLSFLDKLSYPAIPPLYEEAVLIYAAMHPDDIKATGSGFIFRGRRISEPTMNKFRRLQAIVKLYGGPNEAARSAVEHELGDSYFYYYFYVLKG